MIINGKEYTVDEITFNDMCALEKLGVNLMTGELNMLSVSRGIVAWVTKTDLHTAGKTIEEHVINGGDILSIYTEMMKAMEKSDFFQKVVANQKTKVEE